MELGPVERITADAIGEPGFRTFYLQARSGGEVVTVAVEKQQVQLLASSILEILADITLETGVLPEDDALHLEEPIDAMFRVGRLSIGYEPDRDLFLLELEEFIPELEEDDPEALLLPEPQVVRLWGTREQMLALSRYSTAVVEQGRPTCQFCGNPIDPRGHMCPAMNGHHSREA